MFKFSAFEPEATRNFADRYTKSGAPVCPERRFYNTNYIFEPLEPFEPPRAPDERIFVSNE